MTVFNKEYYKEYFRISPSLRNNIIAVVEKPHGLLPKSHLCTSPKCWQKHVLWWVCKIAQLHLNDN